MFSQCTQIFFWRNRFLRGRFTRKAKKNCRKFILVSYSFLRTWLAFKVRKGQKEALKAPGRHDSMRHPTPKFRCKNNTSSTKNTFLKTRLIVFCQFNWLHVRVEFFLCSFYHPKFHKNQSNFAYTAFINCQ